MVRKHPLERGAQIGRRREVAVLIELRVLQARPIGDDAAARDCAAGQEGNRRRAMVGARGAVNAGRAAELGDGDDSGIFPKRAEVLLDFLERAVEAPEQLREAAARATFVRMGVPALEGQRGNAGTIGHGHQARRALGGLTHASDRIVARARLRRAVVDALARGDPVDFKAARERLAQGRITMGVEIEEPNREIVGGVRQVLRRPAEHRRGSAQNERRPRSENQPNCPLAQARW